MGKCSNENEFLAAASQPYSRLGQRILCAVPGKYGHIGQAGRVGSRLGLRRRESVRHGRRVNIPCYGAGDHGLTAARHRSVFLLLRIPDNPVQDAKRLEAASGEIRRFCRNIGAPTTEANALPAVKCRFEISPKPEIINWRDCRVVAA